MYNGFNNSFSNNKEINTIQNLPSDEIFMSNTIPIPKQYNQIILEEGSSENDDEPDASRIHSISSSDNDDNSNNSNSNENEKKEIDSIFDFENIELPKEEEYGDFTVVTNFKIESLDSKIKKENNIKNEEPKKDKQKGKVKKEKDKKEKDKKEKDKKEKDKKEKDKKEKDKKEKDKKEKDKKEKVKEKKKTENILEEESEEEEDEIEDKMESWDLLKMLVLTKSKKKSTFMGNFKHFLSSVIYNYKSFNDKLNKINIKFPINIFDSKIQNYIDINYSLLSFLYMSYRSGFCNMKYYGMGDFTSDCGWGCMLRCCQMMLSRGLFRIKIKEYCKSYKKNNNNANILLSKNEVINIKNEILNLFYDGKIQYNKIRSNLFLTHFFQLYQELADIKGISTNISEMIPPYSIYTLCYLGKCQGVYTSDVRMIKCFLRINKLLFDSLNMIHFENGQVEKSSLFENFLFIYDKNNKEIKEKKYCIIYKYKGREFIFDRAGLVFISFRLGLQNLDESYYNIISIIFSKIHNNIGFVSGKKNRAYYFIGCNGDGKLIFVDPHFNQKVEEYKDFLLSYNIPELYILNVNELSGELTLGIAIYDLDDFKILIEDLEYLSSTFPYFITFK